MTDFTTRENACAPLRTLFLGYRARAGLAAALVAIGILSTSDASLAAGGAEGRCQAGRYNAAAKFFACEQKVEGKLWASENGFSSAAEVINKCLEKYVAGWERLQERAAGTAATCDNPRFLDGGATVTDRMTGLQWEKKTNLDSVVNLSDPHDADNAYEYTLMPFGTAADGPVFTAFLAALNTPPCFEGQCDWRIPTYAEQWTIGVENCPAAPCIDAVFGPTVGLSYWSITGAGQFLPPSSVWALNLAFGVPQHGTIGKPYPNYVRAVRGGMLFGDQ
jgi:hypothetical protein